MPDRPSDTEDLTPEEQAAAADPHNAAEPIAIRRKKQAADDTEKALREVMKALLSVPDGRVFLRWMLFDVCGVFRTSVNAAFDTNATIFREGAKEVGFLLHKLALRSDAKQYMVVLTENVEQM